MNPQRIELPAWESTELLRSASVGRICVIDHGYPVTIPINYTVVGGTEDAQIVERLAMGTAPETILGRYEGLGSLEVDNIDLEHGTAWSVIVRGSITAEVDAHELSDEQPHVDTNRERRMTLLVHAITGRRFAVHRSAAACSAPPAR